MYLGFDASKSLATLIQLQLWIWLYEFTLFCLNL
uniref:Uncharacterized protein n=1 Tax=Rhizophora mucronata TaxID=61149 RepID=A0A2P2QWC1_RHIMU